MYGGYSKRFKAERVPPPFFLMRRKKYRGKGYRRGRRVPYSALAETKYFDFLQNTISIPAASNTTLGTSVTTAPLTVGCCFAPTLGNDITNRIGRKCAVHKIRIQGSVVFNSQSAQNSFDNQQIVRLVLFIDKQANASQATLADVFQTNANLTSPSGAIHVPQNLATLGRFRVLKDKKMAFDSGNATGSPTAGDVIIGPMARNFKFSIKFRKPLIVHFNATNGGTYADIVENCIQFISVGAIVTATPSINYYGRVCYSDV